MQRDGMAERRAKQQPGLDGAEMQLAECRIERRHVAREGRVERIVIGLDRGIGDRFRGRGRP